MEFSAVKTWVLFFDMYHPSQHHCTPVTLPHGHGTPWWQSPPPAGKCTLLHHNNRSGIVWGTWQRGQSANLVPKLTRSQNNRASTGWNKSDPLRSHEVGLDQIEIGEVWRASSIPWAHLEEGRGMLLPRGGVLGLQQCLSGGVCQWTLWCKEMISVIQLTCRCKTKVVHEKN